LVNSVLSSLPLYMMLFHKIPTWVVDQIDKVRRSFFLERILRNIILLLFSEMGGGMST